MIIQRLYIKNFKLIDELNIELNSEMNIFVGENDSGKSTILEALSIITTGKLNGYAFEKQIKANLFNNIVRTNYIDSLLSGQWCEPPKIILEAYFGDGDAQYSGTNNFLRSNVSGIHVEIAIRKECMVAYKMLLDRKEIFDIPVELYSVEYKYFNGDTVVYRIAPIKAIFIDTTRKDYSYVINRFVAENIATYLTEDDQRDISTAYRKSRHEFQNNDVVNRLNQSISKEAILDKKKMAIDLKENNVDAWKDELSVIIEDIPFENIGFGTQNTIKIELAIKNSANQANIVLIEEPENNLSFTNMVKMISYIQETLGKQIFISTHSSFVANKLNLRNIFLVKAGKVIPFLKLPEETAEYFKKLPGYNTLQTVLAERLILVEGPTDNLIFQKAYFDICGKLPIQDGIDIITVGALAFKRYCDICILLNKKVVIVTDNDGNIQENIMEKYKDYIMYDNLKFIYEKNENLNTIEPSVLNANCTNNEPTKEFKEAISKDKSLINKKREGILKFMLANKTEWAMRVFESDKKIVYPEYIKDAIKQFN